MSPEPTLVQSRAAPAVLATNRLIRNTYILLSMTLLFSAATASASMVLRMPPMTYLLSIGGAFVLMVFVLPRFKNSVHGLWMVFGITGLLGFGLGPLLNMYLSMPGGSQIIATALGGTGILFLGLSGYSLVSRQDFSFLGGFLITGFIVILAAAIANIFLGIPALSLAISAAVIMIMSGFILYDTSRMIHGGETNYVMATIGLYVSIFNIFVHLLALLGIAGSDD